MKTFKVLLIFAVLAAPMTAYAGIDADLIKAAKNGDLAKVKVLLDKGADIDARQKSFLTKSLNTPLMLASYNGRQKVVEELLKRGASVFLMNSYGGTALILAAWKGHAGIAKALVEKGADINAQTNKGTTALMKASMHGYPSVAKLLIEKGANINMQANDGWTALMYTARYGQKAISKVLLEKGADASATSDKGKTALTITTNAREFQIVQLLKNSIKKETAVAQESEAAGSASSVSSGSSGSGASGEPRKIDRVFINVVKIGDIEMVKKLLAKGANPGANHSEPLRVASQKGYTEIVKLLLDTGVNVDDRRYGGRSGSYTALHEASANGYADIVKLLLKNGADINLTANVNYMTLAGKIINPVKIASGNCQLSVVKVLIDNGVNLEGAAGSTTKGKTRWTQELRAIRTMGGNKERIEQLTEWISDCQKTENLITLAEAKQLLK